MLPAFALLITAAAQPAPLTLEDAVRAAVAHNGELLQQRLVADRAAALERAAWWGFTPDVTLETFVADDENPRFVGTTLGDHVGTTARSDIGVQWTAPVGTDVRADLVLSRPLAGAPDATDDGAVVLSVRQPLLKGAWLSGAGAPLDQASLQAQIAREGLRRELESFIVDVESAYWDLALAQADVEIKERSLARARQQFDDTQENIRRGILADAEIYLVDENRVFFEAELARAVEDRAQTQRKLAQLLWRTPGDAADLRAAEDLAALHGADAAAADRARSVERGLATSPGLAEQRLRAELARSRERAAAVTALPQLDVEGALALGAEGKDGHRAVDRVFRSPFPDARVGLVLSVPLGVPAVRASVEAQHIDAESARLDVESAELHLRHDVENAIGDLALGLKLEALGRQELDLAGKKLTAQEDKYKNGISTLADVVRFQRELDEASIALRQRVRAVHVARARLLALEGRLAESAGVEVAR